MPPKVRPNFTAESRAETAAQLLGPPFGMLVSATPWQSTPFQLSQEYVWTCSSQAPYQTGDTCIIDCNPQTHSLVQNSGHTIYNSQNRAWVTSDTQTRCVPLCTSLPQVQGEVSSQHAWSCGNGGLPPFVDGSVCDIVCVANTHDMTAGPDRHLTCTSGLWVQDNPPVSTVCSLRR